MEFSSSSPKHHHPVRAKSSKKKSPSVAPIPASFLKQTSILPCNKSSDFSNPSLFRDGGVTSAADVARPFVFGASPSQSGTGTENDGFGFGARSKKSEFCSDFGVKSVNELTEEVSKIKMDERTEKDEQFGFGKSTEKENCSRKDCSFESKSDGILGSDISQIPDFEFRGAEMQQKEIKMGKNVDKRSNKKGEIRKNPSRKKIGGNLNYFAERTDFVSEKGDYEPMDYSPYEEVIINSESNSNNNETEIDITELKYSEKLAKNNSNVNKNVFGEEKDSNSKSDNLRTEMNNSFNMDKDVFGEEKDPNFKSEDLRTEMSNNLDSKIDTQINGGILFNSSGEFSGNSFSFSTSKNPNSDQSTSKRHNRKKNNKSRVSQSFHTVKNTYIFESNNSELAFDPLISHNINLNKSSTNLNKETVGTEEDCEKWRARGNKAYEKGDIKSAEEFYSIGINSLSPDSKSRALMLCYSNRAACRISLGKMRDALNDCLIAINIDEGFLKVTLRAANCLLAIGDFEEAIKYYNKCLESNPDPKISSEASSGLQKAKEVSELINQAEGIVQKGKSDEISKALEIISEAFLISSHSDKIMKIKAEILLKVGRYEYAIEFCEKNLNENGKDFDAQIWRFNIISKSYFYLGKLDEALQVLRKKEQARVDSSRRRESGLLESDSSFLVTVQELIRLKALGNEAFQAGKFTEASDHYTSAINSSTESRNFTAVLLCNRAAAFQALNQITDAIADCSIAVGLCSSYAKAISRRATLYEMIRDYTQAAKDLQTLISLLEKNNQIQENQNSKTNNDISEDLKRARQRLLSAEEEAKKDVPLNLYLILGVEQMSSAAEVKKAYRKAALRHHPDKAGQFLLRNENINDAFHKDADHLFKIIGEAYNVLSDSTKRMKYDNEEQKRASKKKGFTR